MDGWKDEFGPADDRNRSIKVAGWLLSTRHDSEPAASLLGPPPAMACTDNGGR